MRSPSTKEINMSEDRSLREALDALANYDAAMDALGSCGDGNCVIKRPKGMHTNGGCHCYEDRTRARRAMACASYLRARLDAALKPRAADSPSTPEPPKQ
jgi:hypothetical protein